MQQLLLLRAALRERWRLVIVVFLLVTLAATAAVYLRKPVFESRAAVLVNVERLGVSVSRADVRQDVAVLQAVEAVTSQAEVLRSNDLIERTLDRLDPAIFQSAPPRNRFLAAIVSAANRTQEFVVDLLRQARLLPPRDERYELVKQLADNLRVSTVRQAQVIRIGFSANSPEAARTVLQQMLLLYVERAASNTVEAEGAGMLLRQADVVRAELEAAERALFEVRVRHGIADLAAEKSDMMQRINRLTTVIEGVDDPASAGAARPALSVGARTVTERSLIELPANGSTQSAVGSQLVQLRSQLSALRVSRAGLAADLASEHPRLRSLDQQIASTEQLLQREYVALKETIAGYRARLNTLIGLEPQLQSLQRNAAILAESYDVYRKASEDRRLMREQEARLQIQIIDPPSVPYLPRGPVPALLVAAGAALGLLSGVALAILMSFLHGSATSPRASRGEVAVGPDATRTDPSQMGVSPELHDVAGEPGVGRVGTVPKST